MGIDFNNLIANLGKASANMQNDKTKIDTKSELNAYVSGWDAIKAKAEKSNNAIQNGEDTAYDNANISDLEQTMKSELANLMGADFGKSAGVKAEKQNNEVVFSEDEISLENMMSLLAPEDNLDIDKLREFNKKPMLSSVEERNDEVATLENAGFSSELVNILMDETPSALKHITNSIKTGAADRIKDSIKTFDGLAQNEKDMDILGYIKYDSLDRT